VWGGPVGGDEIDTPEMWRRGEELKADPLAFIGGVAKKDDAAFLLFLCEWVGNDEYRIHVERLIQVHQAAVRIDHDGLAGLAETAAVGVLPGDDYAHPHEHSGTASSFIEIRFWHDNSMLRHFHFAVNETVMVVFPLCNLILAGCKCSPRPGSGLGLLAQGACFHVSGAELRAMIPLSFDTRRANRGGGS
jgi:hypothetical protein